MKNFIGLVFYLIALTILVTGCGGSATANNIIKTDNNTTVVDNNTTVISVNNAPVAKASTVSLAVFEYAEKVCLDVLSNFSDIDGDVLTVVGAVSLDGNSTLPEGLTYNLNTYCVDLSAVNIADGVNAQYDYNITVSDGNDTVSAIYKFTLQDTVNDAILIMSDMVADVNVTLGDDLNISLSATDTDGITSATFDVYASSDTGYVSSLTSGILSTTDDSNYIATISTDSLSDGNYTVVTKFVGIVGGENPNSTAQKVFDFSVLPVIVDKIATITAPTLNSKTSYSIDTTAGTLSDEDGVRSVTVKLYLNSTLTTLVKSNINGDFSGLSSSTTYYVVTTGEALNATNEMWEVQTSSALSFTTSSAPVTTPTPAPTPQETCEAGGGFWDGSSCFN